MLSDTIITGNHGEKTVNEEKNKENFESQSITDKTNRKGRRSIRKHLKFYSILFISAIISAGTLTALFFNPSLKSYLYRHNGLE